MMAKKKRDYDAADRVQDLLKGAGVYVDDRTRTYEIRVPRPKREELPEKVYARSIEDDSNIALAPHDYEQLVARLQERQRAVRQSGGAARVPSTAVQAMKKKRAFTACTFPT